MSKPALLLCDLETTGLNPDDDEILEVGFTLVDKELYDITSVGYTIHIKHIEYNPFEDSYEPPFGIHNTVAEMHTKNGLWEASYRSRLDNSAVYDSLIGWFQKVVAVPEGEEKIPICGNTVGQFDVQFLRRDFPALMDFVHYRVLDISSLRIANDLWGDNINKPTGNKLHRSLPDIQDSLAELRYYQRKLWLV